MSKTSVLMAAAAMTVVAAFGVTVENDNLAVSFYENDVGKGRVAQIVAKKTGQKFVAGARPMWLVECRRTDDFTKRKVVNSMQTKAFSHHKIADGWVFEYRDVEDCLAEVICRVTADPGDGMIRWRFSATPKPGWAVYETDYPSVCLTPSIGDSPEDDCVVTGDAKGGVVRYPMDPKREYWKSRHYSTSPGHLTSPFGAFYDPAGGLYTAAEDTEGYFKGLLMDRWWRQQLKDGTFREGDFLLEWRHFEFSPTTFSPTYDVVMRAFGGRDGEATDWRDAADIYRAWAKDRRWCRTKMVDRPDLPDWAKKGPAQMKFNRAWFRHPGLVKRWCEEYFTKRFPGVPFVAEIEGWEHHGDWVTPEYFPCYPSDADFTAFCKTLNAAGGHAWAWPGGHHWNVRVGKNPDGSHRLDYSELFEREVKANVCANPDGTPRLDSLSWLGGGESATLCPATAYGRDWWNDYVACGLVSRGVDLVQADQDVCAQVRACWNPKHGHTPGDGRWMTRALRHQFETQLAKTRKLNPWAQFSFEEPNEYYNDLLCFQDYRNCRFFGSEWASVFNYLYHEYITPYQPGSEFYSKWYWVAHSAADGQMPRLPELPDYYFPMPVVSNGGFEEPQLGVAGFVGWYGTRFGQTVVTNDCTEGRYALGMITSPTMTNICAGRLLSPKVLKPGLACKVSVQLKSLRAAGARRGGLRVLEPTKGESLARLVPPAETGVWQRVEATFVVPESSAGVRLDFLATDGVAYLADDVKLYAKGADGAYEEVRLQYGEEVRKFAERWVDLYHANRQWLQHGRHLHPPKIDCERLPYVENFRGRRAELVKPSVFVGAFRSAAGEDAFFMANATDREQTFTLTWRGEKLARTLSPRGLKFEVVK